jgi:hypothetical protein
MPAFARTGQFIFADSSVKAEQTAAVRLPQSLRRWCSGAAFP